MAKKQFAVFGLGHFGGSLVKAFYNTGTDVMAVDKDMDKVNEYTQFAAAAIQANVMDEAALNKIGIRNFDHVFVSFGDDIEASILVSLILKEMGIQKVWTKAQNNYHKRVLYKVGVDRVIHPEMDMANRIAHHIISENILDYIELSSEFGLVEIMATNRIHQRTIAELDVRAKYGCNIVAIKRKNDILVSPAADDPLYEGDILIVIGGNKDINRFEKEGV